MKFLSDIAPLLGVLLPCIAAIFAYRASERQRARDLQSAAKPDLHVIGGALASQGATKLYVEEWQRLTASIDRMADSNHTAARAALKAAEATLEAAQATADNSGWCEAVLDELKKHRRATEEIASLMQQRQRDNRGHIRD